MNIRYTFLALAIATAAMPAAYASTGATFIGGELGYQTHATVGAVTRAQVLNDAASFRAHPVQHDGTVVVGGEIGFASQADGAYAHRSPQGPNTGPNTRIMGQSGAAARVAPAPMRRHSAGHIGSSTSTEPGRSMVLYPRAETDGRYMTLTTRLSRRPGLGGGYNIDPISDAPVG